MELSKNQMQVLLEPLGIDTIIEGYSGVGKTTVLLKKYEQIFTNNSISKNDAVFIVSNHLKKQIVLQQYFLLSSKYNTLNVYTINELIDKYLRKINLPLFQNTIDENQKKSLISDIMESYYRKSSFTVDFILEEINYIQSNICLKDDDVVEVTLTKELKTYLLIPRKSISKGLLSFREKQVIWSIYTDYLNNVLNRDIFDEQTFYQSFLRLIYHHFETHELAFNFSIIFIDDVQEFTRVQLDILYYLYNKNNRFHASFITVDELKSMDRYKNFNNSYFIKRSHHKIILDTNFRNSNNVFNIIKSNLIKNELLNPTLNYKSKSNRNSNKSVLTYFYNRSLGEKKEVFFDRIDLLIGYMGYRFKDILVVFNDVFNLNEMKEECQLVNIKIFDINSHVENKETDALTFAYKKDLINCEFKVVMIYDADNNKLCTGPINKIININRNFEDSIYFYTAISTATDFLIINSSISEPSHLLLPSHINYDDFVFEVGSKFEIKSTLNIYRISDFIGYIKENLIKYYNLEEDNLKNHPIFDIFIEVDTKTVGVKILDNNIDNDVIENILRNGNNYSYIIIFDSHHYVTFKNIDNDYIRVIDIPNNLKE